jgi:hypothetical protein
MSKTLADQIASVRKWREQNGVGEVGVLSNSKFSRLARTSMYQSFDTQITVTQDGAPKPGYTAADSVSDLFASFESVGTRLSASRDGRSSK